MTSHAEPSTEASELTVSDFLRARISEDETNADTWGDLGVAFGGVLFPPERWRAEIAAKRRILEMYEGAAAAVAALVDLPGVDDVDTLLAGAIIRAGYVTAEAAIKIEAAVYADHPDYRGGWRP